jgi:agmatinase
MIDPASRWKDPEHKPPYAGLASFAELPWSEDPRDLEGVTAAIFGAPFDALASDRLGSREGPRAIRVASRPLGPEVATGVDPGERMKLIDYGDAPVDPFDVGATRAAIGKVAGEIVSAGAIPVMLGGDHSVTLPALRACADAHGPMAMVHFDTHTDTGIDVYGDTDNHGTMMRTLVAEGHVDSSRYVQIGLRGGWPGQDVFAWQAEVGISHFTAEDVRRDGIDEIVERAIEIVGAGPVYLTVDIDVLDPAFAGQTGTPEAGGLLSRELIAAVRTLGRRLDLRGADLVEVVPGGWGTGDVGAMTGASIVGSMLTGMAERAPGRMTSPLRDRSLSAAPDSAPDAIRA